MPEATHLCGFDLETGGLNELTDPILEVGVIITTLDAPAFTTVAEGQFLIRPSNANWVDNLPERVREMHTETGLIADVEAKGLPREQVDALLAELLERHAPPHYYMSFGSGVSHFDRRFVKQQLPKFNRFLQHPNLDVGVIRRGFQFAGAEALVHNHTEFTDTDPRHRALADIRDHLAEWRRYSLLFREMADLRAEWVGGVAR